MAIILLALAAVGVLVLCHLAPFPFLLDAASDGVAMWEGPRERSGRKVVYLTLDDGPNPTATPELLDVLREKNAAATFFVIDAYVHEGTAPILRRAFADGHAVALHSGARWLMLKSPDDLARAIDAAAARVERFGGHRPCRLFRPHGGWRSLSMIRGLRRSNYRLAATTRIPLPTGVTRPVPCASSSTACVPGATSSRRCASRAASGSLAWGWHRPRTRPCRRRSCKEPSP